MSAVLGEIDMSALTDGPALRWGVVGAGRIAVDFVNAVHRFTEQRVVTVADVLPERARAFAQHTGVTQARTVDELLDDPSVDVVYVAVTNDAHVSVALRCVEAGKAALVEKPLARTAAEAERLVQAARSAGVFVAEAMWTRHLPHVHALERLLWSETLGELRWIAASTGAAHPYDPASRLFDPGMGGGALLDIGVYGLSLVSMLLGAGCGPRRKEPASTGLRASGMLSPDGVDVLSVLTVVQGGACAVVSSSIVAPLPDAATVVGERGAVTIGTPFFAPTYLDVRSHGGQSWRWTDDSGLAWRDGLAWQAAAVARYVAQGLPESPRMPLGESVAVLGMVDDAVRQLRASGLVWTPPGVEQADESAARAGRTEAVAPPTGGQASEASLTRVGTGRRAHRPLGGPATENLGATTLGLDPSERPASTPPAPPPSTADGAPGVDRRSRPAQ